ncbi:phospho-N-acetylmuramoyl-pentapeptide-transferase [Spirulina sp. CS-785/01]|uniref:phospho-N-acetylmuramoyl-pentapeptide- transferase n=1 Tax=Spirulina sp. CS-785/01 TaxID=3021716 RepID=UPI00233129C0|nr:phospho-N-acetylmuramoyl-pentapeptide-transferase [Spirulina sp. CS-785/01]MDB9314605.1 phospho-N-acetylmuramoyl-pentapeptide-transferase [Spirulina sp. CS-785/01]
MEAKAFLPNAVRKPSGISLLILLVILLGGVGITFDLFLGGVSPLQSLTLPLLVSAVASSGVGVWVIPILQRLKAGQFIQEDGPQTHLKKAGTPTMGGIFFVPVAVLLAWVWSGFAGNALAVGLITLLYGFMGWLDDWQILRRKSNKGITPPMKLLLQIGGAVVFCVWMVFTQPASITNIELPLGVILPLGVLFWPLAVFVFAAESNATNLTDGVDGLAGGTGAIALLGMAALTYPTHPDLATFCTCLSGGCLGFVSHNRNPAKVFMGDTGSLALGAALAGVGILSGNLWGLFVISGLFFIESLSVIAQVGYYKATKNPQGVGKRLLKMAPVHHHLELTGWQETQIVGIFYLISFGLILLALLV